MISPAYMMAMRSLISAITEMSWVMSRMELPLLSRSSRILRMMRSCTSTSSPVVGSSMMTRAGSSANAMAIMARWRMPPENSCG